MFFILFLKDYFVVIENLETSSCKSGSQLLKDIIHYTEIYYMKIEVSLHLITSIFSETTRGAAFGGNRDLLFLLNVIYKKTIITVCSQIIINKTEIYIIVSFKKNKRCRLPPKAASLVVSENKLVLNHSNILYRNEMYFCLVYYFERLYCSN